MNRIYTIFAFLSYVYWVIGQNTHTNLDVDLSHPFKIEHTYLSTDTTKYIVDITYFDGFNRPLQEIQVDGSAGTQSDLVTPHVYAAFGQEEKKYLPFVKQHNSGAFVTDALNVINWNTYGTDEMAYAFSKTDYEASPLNRILKQTGEGQAWHTREKGITYAYALNAANEVRRYTVSADGTLTRNGFYDAGTLQAVTTTDEDGHTSTTYTDNLGQEILLLQADGKTRLETYKVYDGRGLLRWVLSPEAVAQLGEGTDAAVLERLAYYYEYDGLKRMKTKRMPGCKPIYMIYDCRDRMVLSQDGNERNKDPRIWSYTKYDAQGRIIETGEITLDASQDREALQTAADQMENYLPTGIHSALQYTYYDSYGSYTHQFMPTEGFATTYNAHPIGQVTSVRSRKLGTDEWQTITTYYDDHARPVQVVSDETGGGLLRICTAYDFVGNVIRTREQHADGSFIETNRTYDRRSRLLTTSTTKDGGTPAVITYTYDELGRPVAKKYGNTTEQLRYNIRGWLTAKESAPFKMQLHYETPLAGTAPCYNGNISEWTWTHEGHATLMYGFAYDGFSRLASAIQKQRDGLTWTTPAASFTEKGITYDRNGNIRTLQRTACGKLVDDLLYAYSGNRLTALSEQVRTSQQGDVYQPGNAAAGSYEYDSNGNLTKDSRKALSFTYNRLNLTDEVKQGGVLKARYQYLTDGTKLTVRDGSGKNGYDYAGSFIYKVADGKREFDRAIVGDVQFTSQGTRYALTDQLGSIRALIDDKGKVVQQNDFYPFGAKAERDGLAQAEDNRFLFSGKECQALIDLNAYDFGARMYDASLGRWTAVDPLAEKYTNLSPYNYCINNPLVIVDPDGKDAIITIVGNTITITAIIFIYGHLATEGLASLYMENIQNVWGLLTSYNFEGMDYKIDWQVNVIFRPDISEDVEKDDLKYDGKTNYMKVLEENKGSSVTDSQFGDIRFTESSENAMSHEFGHMMGLKDRYKDGGAPVSPEWNFNIMHDIKGAADKQNMDFILTPVLQIDKQLNLHRQSVRPNPNTPWNNGVPRTVYHINKKNREL